MRSLEATQPIGDPAGTQAAVEAVDSGSVPEEVLQLEEAVPVRRRHEELAARLQLLADHGQRVAQLVVVQVLEDLRRDHGIELPRHVAQVGGQERVRGEALSLEHLAAVGDARLVEVDPGHVVAPGAQRDRDQAARPAAELDGAVLLAQVVAQPEQALPVPVDVLAGGELHQPRLTATRTKRTTSRALGRRTEKPPASRANSHIWSARSKA